MRYPGLDLLKSGSSIRFTATEVDELAELGIYVAGAKSAEDFAARLEPWLHTLAQKRPELIEKIARAVTAAKRIQQRPLDDDIAP